MLNAIMLNAIMLNAIMLNAIMLNAIMLNVIMMSVMAPLHLVDVKNNEALSPTRWQYQFQV
jgi:hypothetical protein